MSKSFTGAEGFTELTQARLIADLRAARVEAGISSEDAAKTLGIPREVFDDVEAGRINLNMTEIREYAWVVGVVIEYSVNPLSESIKSQLAKIFSEVTKYSILPIMGKTLKFDKNNFREIT